MSSTHSRGASRGTESERPSPSSGATSLSTSSRRRRGPRSSTGSCHGSGTSAKHGSRRRTGVAWRGSRIPRSTSSVTASRSTSGSRGDELLEHVFTDPLNPDRVPYRTSYWAERWGFCMAQREVDTLPPGEYRAVVDSTLEDGSLTYGEVRLDGASPRTVLLTTTVCHPALANDNLSGIVVTAARGAHTGDAVTSLQLPASLEPGDDWAALLAPPQPGADRRDRARARDLVCGDRGGVTYKRSRRWNDRTDRAAEAVLRNHRTRSVVDWSPYGGDERQFCAPGFDLPFGAFSRSPADAFPEYHSSDDDLSVVTPEALADSYRTLLSIIDAFERDATYVNASPVRRAAARASGPLSLGRRRVEPGGCAAVAAEPAATEAPSLVDVALRSGLPVRRGRGCGGTPRREGLARRSGTASR